MQRRHDLDWLRVGAVLLLLPFHSARVFDPSEDFYVHAARTSEPLFWWVIAAISMWQMELLFVLAGAASWYAFGRRTVHDYRIERVKRLLVPFVFGCIVIVPVQAYLAVVWRGGSSSVMAFLGDYWTFKREIFGYDGGFTPGHLWFILYLFLYSVVAAPLFARWHADRGERRWVRWYLIGMPLVLWLAEAIPSPKDGPQNLLYSFALFVGGFLLVSEPGFEGAVHRAWRWLVPVAAALLLSRLWIAASGTYDRLDTGATSDLLDLYRMTVTWVIVLALLALGYRFLSFETPFLRWGNEGAYPIYLLHQSVIIVAAYAVLSAWGAAPLAGWLVLTGISLSATIAIYTWLVRPFDPVRFLFGMKPRVQSRPPTTVAAPEALRT